MSNAPNSPAFIQQEALETTLPVSESLMFAIGGAINYCLTNSAQVGDIQTSMLDLLHFQEARDTTWVLCDGTAYPGSSYASLIGPNVPDLRGRYQRMKDYSAGNDSHGNLAVGSIEADQVGPHQHDWSGFGETPIVPPYGSAGSNFTAVNVNVESFLSDIPLTNNPSSGAPETNPKSVVVNYFVKINP